MTKWKKYAKRAKKAFALVIHQHNPGLFPSIGEIKVKPFRKEGVWKCVWDQPNHAYEGYFFANLKGCNDGIVLITILWMAVPVSMGDDIREFPFDLFPVFSIDDSFTEYDNERWCDEQEREAQWANDVAAGLVAGC